MRNFVQLRKLAVAAVGVLVFGSPIGANAQHQHGAHAHQTKPVAKPAKKWETDEALRQAMDNIRQAFMTNQAAIRQDRFSARQYRQFAETVDNNIGDIVKNCKLAPDADAALHETVLMNLIRSDESMTTSKKRSVQRASALNVLQSLRQYGEYFNHPGWDIDGVKTH